MKKNDEEINILNEKEIIKLKELKEEIKILNDEDIEILNEIKKKENEIIILKEIKNEKKILINEKEEKVYQLKVNKGNKKIIIIYMLSGNELPLTKTVNIMSDSLLDLYNIIQNEINKNIFSMSINDYLYTHDNYTTNNCSTLKDTINRESSRKPYERQKKSNNYLPDYYSCCDDSIDNEAFKKYCEQVEQKNIKNYLLNYHKDNTDISSLLDEDYNNNYIKVSIISSCPMNYIKKTIDNYFHQLIDYSMRRQEYYNSYYFYYKKEGKLVKFINKDEPLIYNLSKLNNNCISFDNYEEIKVYINKTYDDYSRDIDENSYEFLLNELRKYLAFNN